jgi:large subunit ribosomal protein L25
MDIFKLEAKPREVGKKATRAVRRNQEVPCVLYGHNVEPVAFSTPETALNPLVFTSEMHLVQVTLDGKSWPCIVKNIDFHPVSDRPIHADFQVLLEGETLTLVLPIRYLGTPVGKREGGEVRAVLHELEVSVLPKNIPSHIDVDVSDLDIGGAIHVGDLDLPGIEILAPADQTLITVLAPRAEVAEEEEEGEAFAVGEEGGEEASEEE